MRETGIASDRGVFERGFRAQEVGLPREQNLADLARLPGDLSQLGAVGDQGRFDLELFGDPITIGPNTILQLDLSLGQCDETGIPTGAAWQRLGVTLQAGADRGGE